MTRASLVRVLVVCAVTVVIGYGIGYFHRGKLAETELEGLSRSLMLSSTSKNTFLLRTITENKTDEVKAALATFLYGDLVAIQSSLTFDRSSAFDTKACALVKEIEQSGISLIGEKGSKGDARRKVLGELQAYCEKPKASSG